MADITGNNAAPKRQFPYQIKIENRVEDPPRWLSPLLSIVAVVFALLIGALVALSVPDKVQMTCQRLGFQAPGRQDITILHKTS